MDTTMLQTPRTAGRSRFSKALPMPPPPQETSQAASPAYTVPRKLPDLPNVATSTAFPPRMDSVGARFAPRPQELPLPALPAKASEPELQKKMPPIPRKAVGSPPAVGSLPPPPAQPAQTEMADAKKLKRVSSISSLLSAYSNTSSDSVHRSSQGSSVTKGSVASLSPEREAGRGEVREHGAKAYKAYSRSPYEEPSPEEKEIMMHEPLPLPPPMKEASRPITPRVGLPSTPRPGMAPSPQITDDSSSQVTLTSASPPRREIWRRRASSKSDRNIAVAQLNLGLSNGSTAETTAPPAAPRTSQESLADPMMAIPSETINKASPLPPKASSALPGRNVKPLPRQPEVQTTVAPPKPPKDSPTQKSEAAPLSAQQVKATMSAASPLSSPEPPAKSIRRREVGSKTSTQPMQAQQEASPAQHLREARSAISLRSEAERSERIQREAAQEKFPEELQQFQESAAAAALSSPRARRPSNPPQAPRLAAAPQLTVTSPRARAAPRVPVEYKDQEPLQLTPQEERSLSDAISRVVNRENWNWAQASPNKQGVWPCKELTSDHIACLSDHRRWLHMENSSVPIACMLCHEGERGHRRLCKTCGIRVCVGCADVLTGRKIGELDFDSLAGKTQDMGKSKGVATAAQ